MAERHLIYLALGTNLGDREENLRMALEALPPPVEITAVSRLYETAPAYVLNQPSFLNIAVGGYTNLLPAELLAFLKDVEAEVGRRETIRYGPRKIDLDIIFYDDLVINLPQLHIPHPRMVERGFVLRPLADIASNFVHPVLKQSVAELAAGLPPDDGILNVTDWLSSRRAQSHQSS